MGLSGVVDEIHNIPVGEKTDRGWMGKRELVPGRVTEVPGLPAHSGLTVHRLPKTGFVVAEVHYSVEHARREPGWAKASSARYGRRGFRSYKWRQEMEIDFDASSGDPVYANWEPRIHVVDPFVIPPHWPRWLMYDPGGVNPHAVEWWAMDPTPPFYPLFAYRQWYRGLEMPDKSEGQYYLGTDVVRIAHELSIDHLGHLEKIDALIMDPAARKTQATAGGAGKGNDGDQPTMRAMTMYEEIIDVADQLGWNIDVVTGNNLKDAAIDDCIERLGNYPLYEEEDGEPILDEEGDPIPLLDDDGEEMWVPPRIFVFRGCRWLAWEFAHYKWANWTSDVIAEQRNRPEAPVDKNDHSMTNVVRLLNWIRRDDELYGGGNAPTPAEHAAQLVANWRQRRKEEISGQ
ncbi:MAG: hypothetical protein GY906_30135 [bacterium]|nr:hypothetical protein [bacterium]